MTNYPAIDQRKNKNFVVKYGSIIKEYAEKNHSIHGLGIVVVNLLLLKDDSIEKLDLDNFEAMDTQDFNVEQPISYIPKTSFWFKMINLKIKKKHQIDLKKNDSFIDKFLVVFIKDASIEHFSIYSIKV
ncbi:MAG: hypothetical protein AAFQ80_09290 [Cyanobacteria bacterium J06621_8]